MNIGVHASFRIMFSSGCMPSSGIKTQHFLTPSCSSTGIWPSDRHTSLPFALGIPEIPMPTNFQQHQLWAARHRWDVSSKPIRSCPFPSVHLNIPPLRRAPLSTSEQWGRAAGAVAQEVFCHEMGGSSAGDCERVFRELSPLVWEGIGSRSSAASWRGVHLIFKPASLIMASLTSEVGLVVLTGPVSVHPLGGGRGGCQQLVVP